MGNEALEALYKEINDRLAVVDGLKEAVSEERIKQIVATSFADLTKDETFIRKMRFGGDGSERKLVGTKYARWGLSIADIEFLYELQQSLRGQRRVDNTGAYNGPSEELENTFRAISEAFYLPQDKVREMDQAAIDNLFPRIPRSWFHGKDRELADRGAFELTEAYQRAMRAMDSAESGYGSQLIGAGYVGLVTGTCFAESGNEVICVDIDRARIERLREGEVPFYEPGLAELVKRNIKDGRLAFETELGPAVAKSMVTFITVGTPMDASGAADLSAVFKAAEQIGKAINGYHIVVIKSTVPVGTAARVREIVRRETGVHAARALQE